MHGVLPRAPMHTACRLHRRAGSVGVAMPTDVVPLTASEAASVAFVTVGDGPIETALRSLSQSRRSREKRRRIAEPHDAPLGGRDVTLARSK